MVRQTISRQNGDLSSGERATVLSFQLLGERNMRRAAQADATLELFQPVTDYPLAILNARFAALITAAIRNVDWTASSLTEALRHSATFDVIHSPQPPMAETPKPIRIKINVGDSRLIHHVHTKSRWNFG
jgi:hypothetical protein